jgi:CBS domain-containing protein
MATQILSILLDRASTLHAVSPDSTAFDALTLVAEKGIAAVLVMEEGKLRGIFSGKDYASRVALRARNGRETPVRDAMTSTLITVGPEATVEECMKVMTTRRFRHLPIMKDGEVIGLVTLADLVRHQLAHKQFEIDQLISYVSG